MKIISVIFPIILIITLLAISNPSNAQVESISPDRPGHTFIPTTAPKKWLQSETGFLRLREKPSPLDNERYTEHPSLSVRYGIANRVELRFMGTFATWKQDVVNGSGIERGVVDLEFGGKFNFLKEKGFRPKTALIAHYSSNRWLTKRVGRDTIDGANFRLAMQHSISAHFLLIYNAGMEWPIFVYTPNYVYSISPKFLISEKWFAFVELYGRAWKRKRKPENAVDGGVAYHFNNNLSIDASGGIKIEKGDRNHFYSIGVSYRFKIGSDHVF